MRRIPTTGPMTTRRISKRSASSTSFLASRSPVLRSPHPRALPAPASMPGRPRRRTRTLPSAVLSVLRRRRRPVLPSVGTCSARRKYPHLGSSSRCSLLHAGASKRRSRVRRCALSAVTLPTQSSCGRFSCLLPNHAGHGAILWTQRTWTLYYSLSPDNSFLHTPSEAMSERIGAGNSPAFAGEALGGVQEVRGKQLARSLGHRAGREDVSHALTSVLRAQNGRSGTSRDPLRPEPAHARAW